ncbi:MAG: hypothetical protein ACKVRP_02395 [Bacteroidota bacterium]
MADRHRRKMMANIVAEGLITSDEIDVLLYLRSIGITSKTKLLRALTADDIAKTVEFAVGERRTKYVEKTNKRKE